MFTFFKSTIGKKVLVALSGLVLYGFIIGHMIGNLKIFMGFSPEGIHKLDLYAEFLRGMGAELFGYSTVLWILRGGLLFAVVLHVLLVIQLKRRNRAARKKAYAHFSPSISSFASRTMLYGGIVILLFIIFHLLHFTFGTISSDFMHGHVYSNVYSGFQSLLFVSFYVVALFALAFHLYHGLWSLSQTLGLGATNLAPVFKSLAVLSAVVVPLGFVVVPLAVYLGFLPEPSNVFLNPH